MKALLIVTLLLAGCAQTGHVAPTPSPTRPTRPAPTPTSTDATAPGVPTAPPAPAALPTVSPAPTPRAPRTCLASWYGQAHAGRPTASGEPFDPDRLTAARWDVPFGTRIRVTAPQTGRSVTVRINDRGPARRLGRCIDLSERAFAALGVPLRQGLVDVVLEEVPS